VRESESVVGWWTVGDVAWEHSVDAERTKYTFLMGRLCTVCTLVGDCVMTGSEYIRLGWFEAIDGYWDGGGFGLGAVGFRW
jgi:hypothetical protein